MNDPISDTLVVDGEPLHVLDKAALVQIVEDPSPPRDSVDTWVRRTAARVRAHSDFALAWHLVGRRQSRLWLVLFHAGDRWIRIHWEHLVCPRCQTRSLAANPTMPDLHWGAPDVHATREASWQVPAVPCPGCGATFERHVIWAEIAGPAPAH